MAPESLFRPEVADARRQRVFGEIVLTQPLRTQFLVLLIFGLVGAVVAWVALGSYSRTETAKGILVTDTASAKVIAIRPGLVTELLVREGDVVRAGQRLATIRVEQNSEAGGSAVGESLGAIEAQRGLAGEQVKLAEAKAVSERARIAANLDGLRQQKSDLAEQIGLQTKSAATAQELSDRIEGVVAKGFVSRIEADRRQQEVLAARQELSRLKQQLNAIVAQEATAAAELSRVTVDADSEVVNARVSTETLTQRKAQLEGDRAYSITAPIAGRVAGLQIALGGTNGYA